LSKSEYTIAVDIGATKTVVATYRNGDLNEVERFLTPENPDHAVQRIVTVVQDLTASQGSPTRIGIGAPGPLDPESGVFLQPPNMKAWWGYPFVDRLQETLDLPIILENDANVGALGESVFGSGRGYPSVYYITISTGIGAGLVIDGKVFGGHKGIAGEVYAIQPGHFYGHDGGDNVIELASGPGLIRRTTRRLADGAESSLSAEGLDTHKLLAAVTNGDPLAVEILDDGRNAIAGLVMAMLYALSPSMVVLGGGLCTDNTWYVDPVKERVDRWLIIPALKEIPIARAELWDSAVLYGAAVLSPASRS
jgi:glucokinase